MSQYEIKDLSSNHNYRTELPNIIFEIGLTPHLIGVYSAIKRCAGDTGSCFKSESKLAKELHISKKTLHKFIELLCLENPVLKKSLIIKENRIDKHGDKDTNLLSITDIWPENYSFNTQEEGRVKSTPPRVKSTQGVGQNLPKGRVKFTHKEEPIKKNPLKNLPPPSVPEEKTTKEKEKSKKAIGLAKLCKEKNLPFTPRKVTALYNKYPRACLDIIMEFSKRKPENMNLDYPDSWLNKHVIEQHEYLQQKKDYE